MRTRLLTVREVAKIIGISESEVIDLAQRGEIPYLKIADEFLRFRLEEVEKVKDKLVKQYKVDSNSVSYADKVKDFFYFNDFYIVSTLIIIILLFIIII